MDTFLNERTIKTPAQKATSTLKKLSAKFWLAGLRQSPVDFAAALH
jgi:hypothetical protein